jgi:hypothetical protein
MTIENNELKNPRDDVEDSKLGARELVERLLGLEEPEIVDLLKQEKDTRIIYQAGQLIDIQIAETPKGDPNRLKYGILKRCLNERRKSIMHSGVTRASIAGRVAGKKTKFNV